MMIQAKQILKQQQHCTEGFCCPTDRVQRLFQTISNQHHELVEMINSFVWPLLSQHDDEDDDALTGFGRRENLHLWLFVVQQWRFSRVGHGMLLSTRMLIWIEWRALKRCIGISLIRHLPIVCRFIQYDGRRWYFDGCFTIFHIDQTARCCFTWLQSSLFATTLQHFFFECFFALFLFTTSVLYPNPGTQGTSLCISAQFVWKAFKSSIILIWSSFICCARSLFWMLKIPFRYHTLQAPNGYISEHLCYQHITELVRLIIAIAKALCQRPILTLVVSRTRFQMSTQLITPRLRQRCSLCVLNSVSSQSLIAEIRYYHNHWRSYFAKNYLH